MLIENGGGWADPGMREPQVSVNFPSGSRTNLQYEIENTDSKW